MIGNEKIPTIMVGRTDNGPHGKDGLSIIFHHDGMLRLSKPVIAGNYEAIRTSVYDTIGSITTLLTEIGTTEINILNGVHLFDGRTPAECEKIPEDIFREFSGRLRLFIEKFLIPTAHISAPALAPTRATN